MTRNDIPDADGNMVTTFRVTMTPEEYKQYLAVKKAIGLKAHAEVVRYLINNYYRTVLQNRKGG